MSDKHILLVEDNPDDIALTDMAFRRAKVTNKFVTVGDGEEALDYLFCRGKYADRDLSEKPALILLDLKLPKLGGLEVLRAIQADKNTRSIPVVVLSCSTEEKDQSESYRLGAKSFCSKPTSFTKFIEVIRQVKAKWLN